MGRAAALIFAREGAKVVIADVDVQGGEGVAEEIGESGGEAVFAKTDISKPSDVRTMVDRAVETYGRLDCALNNAAVEGAIALTHEYSMESWAEVMGVNLKGTWLCMKYEIPQMLKQGGGSIVNTSSTMGLLGGSHMSVYTASKHAILGLTKTAAIEYARSGIRINAVCAGTMDTPMIERVRALNPEEEAQQIGDTPLGRAADPKEVAEAAVWLCSDAASFVTGHAMSADGGYVCQ